MLEVRKIDSSYLILITTPNGKIKFWPWRYTLEESVNYVKINLISRWDDCPVKKYQDFTNVFVDSEDKIEITSIKINEIGTNWISDPVNIKRISG